MKLPPFYCPNMLLNSRINHGFCVFLKNQREGVFFSIHSFNYRNAKGCVKTIGSLGLSWSIQIHQAHHDSTPMCSREVCLKNFEQTFNWKVNHTESSDVPWVFSFPVFFGCQIQHFSTKELRQGSAFVSLPGKANEVEQLLRVLKLLVPPKKACDSLMGFNGIQWD